jgi:AraC family transcriptional regulator
MPTINILDNTTDLLTLVSQRQNNIVISSLKEFYKPVLSEGFSIKYVIEGVERYQINGKNYLIDTDRYLLSNQTIGGHVEIESKKQVKGVCINIMPSLFAEVLSSNLRPDTSLTDLDVASFFTSTLFLENRFDAQKTYLGQSLTKLKNVLQKDSIDEKTFNQEFFYTITEQILADQLPVYRQLNALPSIKSVTKKDLYRKLSAAKEYMDSYFLMPLSIETIAREACMSEYHFFRLFKSLFSLSPYQYLLQKRFQYAHSMLQDGLTTVSLIACECGFADVYTFSKAFKKNFGYPPSKVARCFSRKR